MKKEDTSTEKKENTSVEKKAMDDKGANVPSAGGKADTAKETVGGKDNIPAKRTRMDKETENDTGNISAKSARIDNLNIDNMWKKNVAIFLCSQQFSLFGSSVVGFVMIWYITLETSSGMFLTISTLCSFLPQILIAPIAGVWADKYNKKLLIMISDGFIACSTLALIGAFMLGYQSFTLIFIVSAIRSIGGGIQMPAVGAILPAIAPAEKLARINGINTTIFTISTLLSPAIGGALLATFGFVYAMFVDVITATVAVLVMTLLKFKYDKGPLDNHPKTPMTDIKEGISYIRNHDFLLKLLVFYGVVFFLISPVAFLTPLMVERSFGPEVWRLTANEMIWSGGSLIGGIAVAVKGGFKNNFNVLAVCAVAFGITFALLGVAPNFGIYLVVIAISGVFIPFFSAAETVILQTSVEEKVMGRVFSVVGIIISASMPLGMIIFGPLADILKVEYIMIAAGILLALFAPFILKCKKQTNERKKGEEHAE